MKNWNEIINIISILIIAFMFMIIIVQGKSWQRDLAQQKLNIVCENATRSAFETILNAGDLDISYLDMGQVRINPTKSLSKFAEVVCLNYDMAITQANIDHVLSFVPCAVLVCNDGYYVTELGEIMSSSDSQKGEYKLKWSIKKPFMYKASNNKAIALNLYDQTWKMITINNDNTIKCDYGNSFLDVNVAHYGITKDKILELVNDKISNEMLYALNKTNDKADKQILMQLPIVNGSNGINRINRPTFLVVMQGVDFAGKDKLSNATLSGYKTIRKRVVLGFRDLDGNKRYCYEYQIPEELIFNIEDYFDTTYQAAKAGYEPSFDLMEKSVRDDY